MGRTILVADDSPTVQKKASGILTGEGLDVVTVSNGVAAVKKLPTVNPCVVLADVSMPGKDGYEVCEHIKSNAGLSHVFVVLIFSDTDPYEEAKGARVSADGKIKKPFDRDELIATVAKFVNQAEAAAPKAAPRPAEPPAAYEVAPLEEEPPAPAPPAPDLSMFSGGVAFGVPTGEETPAISSDSMVLEAGPTESVPGLEEPMPAHDAALGAIAASATLVPEREPAVVTEPELEIQHEGEAPPPPAPQSAEPLLIEDEVGPPPTEPSPEQTMMFRAPAAIAQPILRDELEPAALVAEAAPEPEVAERVEEPAVETAPQAETALEPAVGAPASAAAEVAGAPAEELAHEAEAAGEPQPVSSPSGETAPEAAPPSLGAAAAEPAPRPDYSDITPPEGTPIPPALTLESYTLSDAAAGVVRFAPPAPAPEAAATEPDVAAPAPEPSAPAAVAAPPAPALDPGQVFSIVHKVVMKMSPPALSPQMIEDIARKFADEIVADLRSDS